MEGTHLYKEGDGNEDGHDEHSSQPVKVEGASAGAVHQGNGHQRHAHHDTANSYRGELGTLVRQTGTYEQPS